MCITIIVGADGPAEQSGKSIGTLTPLFLPLPKPILHIPAGLAACCPCWRGPSDEGRAPLTLQPLRGVALLPPLVQLGKGRLLAPGGCYIRRCLVRPSPLPHHGQPQPQPSRSRSRPCPKHVPPRSPSPRSQSAVVRRSGRESACGGVGHGGRVRQVRVAEDQQGALAAPACHRPPAPGHLRHWLLGQ